MRLFCNKNFLGGSVGSGREAHGKENPRELYAVGLRTEPAPLVRGSSRRITIMRFRPANIRVINRRENYLGHDLRCLLRGKRGKQLLVVDRSFHILYVSENEWRRHNSEMELQGRGSLAPLCTRRRHRTLGLRKTTLRTKVHVQTVGLNAEKRSASSRRGAVFS